MDIYLGAAVHKTPISNIFVPYEPCTIDRKVQTADGKLVMVAGIGSVKVEWTGLLTHVLHVLKPLVTLISV